MRGIVLRGPGKFFLEEMPDPQPEEGELVVRVKNAAICGTDLRMIANGYDGVDEEHPRILGHEFSGEISGVGSGVDYYAPGMRVIVAPNMGCGRCADCVKGNTHLCRHYQALGIQLNGAFAEYVRIPREAVFQGNVMEIEDGLSFEEAALCEPLSCVYNGLEKCGIRFGDTVLIMGAGAIGLLHASLARAMGAEKVFIYDPHGKRTALAKKIDPDFEVFSGEISEVEIWIKEQTNGNGVDVCITACPSPEAQQEALKFMAVGGRVCFFGGLAKNKEEVLVNTNLIHYRELKVMGSTRSNIRQFSEMLQLMQSCRIDLKPFITARFGLSEYRDAFKAAEEGKGIKNVICF